jgi:hypothetical protein
VTEEWRTLSLPMRGIWYTVGLGWLDSGRHATASRNPTSEALDLSTVARARWGAPETSIAGQARHPSFVASREGDDRRRG